MFILEIGMGSVDSEPKKPESNSLQTGVLYEGCASDPTGVAWHNTSSGTDYGHGRRFEHEETPEITKILSRTDK